MNGNVSIMLSRLAIGTDEVFQERGKTERLSLFTQANARIRCSPRPELRIPNERAVSKEEGHREKTRPTRRGRRENECNISRSLQWPSNVRRDLSCDVFTLLNHPFSLPPLTFTTVLLAPFLPATPHVTLGRWKEEEGGAEGEGDKRYSRAEYARGKGARKGDRQYALHARARCTEGERKRERRKGQGGEEGENGRMICTKHKVTSTIAGGRLHRWRRGDVILDNDTSTWSALYSQVYHVELPCGFDCIFIWKKRKNVNITESHYWGMNVFHLWI